tara:strand:- start:84 stop:5075 length:4992 start_codon:yes stop_codon:yes gene_type:complete
MARRDVELVFRARDEAKGALTAINKALEEFSVNTKDVRDEAAKTDVRLASLGGAFRDLKQAVGQLGATGQVERQLRNITDEITRQEAAITRTEAALADYSQRFAQTRQQTQQLTQTQAQLTTQLEKARASVAQSATSQKALAAATDDARKAQRAYAERQQKLTRSITEQNTKLAEYQTRLASLRTEIAGTAQPTAQLTRNFDRTAASIERTQVKIADLVQTQNLVQASSDRAAQSVQRANDIYGRQAVNLDRNKAALERVSQAYREAATATGASAKEQARLEAAAKKSASSLDAQNSSLQKARAAYDQVKGTITETAAALDKLDKTTRAGLLRTLREQITRVKETRQSYKDLSAEASRLGAALAKTANPTNAQVAAFERFREASSKARQEFRAQGQALSNLRSILRESGGDVDVLSNRVQRFGQVLAGARTGYAGLQSASTTAASAARRLSAELARGADASERQNNSTRRLAGSMRQGAQATGLFANAIRRFYGESRTALSFTQRLRGEVLSLVAAYGGFFAAIEGIRGVVNAQQQLEASTNRLNVVFNQDQTAVGNELDFIRRNAARLGVEFGSLANEYTKFAIATQGTNLEGQETRRIFQSVAESARVNGASLDQLQGTFVALTQIVSKGTLSMEELRQQLGDRIPGAINIFADALGLGTAEFIKMVENGEISSDSLSKFADELDKRFGDQLPASLETTTAAIGRFQNSVFEAFLTIGKGGAIEGFTDLLNDLIETLDSASAEDFLAKVGGALQAFFNVIGSVVRNWDLLIIAITTFTAFKLAPLIVGIVATMGRWQAIIRLTRIRTAGLTASLVGLGAGARGAATGLVGMRVALTALMSATGIGLLVTLIGTGIGIWATRGSEATAIMKTHRDIVDQVKNAYDGVGLSVTDVRDRLKDITTIEAENNLRSLQQTYENTLDAFESAIPRNIFGTVLSNGGGFFEEVEKLFQAFRDGKKTSFEFRQELDELSQSYEDLVPVNAQFAQTFDQLAGAVVAAGVELVDASDILTILTGTEEEAEAALKRLNDVVEETGNTVEEEADRLEAYTDALGELQKLVPSLSDELKKFEEAAKLQDAFAAALKLASTYEEMLAVFSAFQQGQRDLNVAGIFDGAASGGVGAAAALLKQSEGFRATPYNDPRTDRNGNQVGEDIFRAGYGSNEITLADGSVEDVVQGISVSMADANRDLIRRIGVFQEGIRGQVGSDRFDSFSDEQQAALTSIAYNYGELPDRIVEAVRTGTVPEIAASIRGLSNDNGGVNRVRRNLEADIFSGGQIDDQAYIDAERERTKELEKQAELRADEAESTADRIASTQFDVTQQELINAGKEREAAIESAIRQAREENSNITAAEIEQIRQLEGQKFDLANADRLANAEKEKAREIEAEINELVQQRVALQALLDQQLASGASSSAIQETEVALQGVNGQLLEAIDNALLLLNTFDQTDPVIAAMVARMRELELSSASAGQTTLITFKQVADTFANTFTSAVMGFAEAIANGEKATVALGQAFRQFASQFLMQIAQMIIQQLALNAAKAIGKAFGFGIAHQGGVIGQGTIGRKVSGAAFAGATRYHSGGIAGLAPGEVPTILQRGEEVLTRGDPRHIFNGGGQTAGGTTEVTPRIVNAIDGASFMEEAMKDKRGQETILNYIQANRSSVRGALGV